MSRKEVTWPGTLVDPCLLCGKNRPEIEFCPMHTYKHASGVYNACETAELRLHLPDYTYVFSISQQAVVSANITKKKKTQLLVILCNI
jgi:hypothetical protein